MIKLGINSDRIMTKEILIGVISVAVNDPEYEESVGNSVTVDSFKNTFKMLSGYNKALFSGYERAYNMYSDDKSRQVLLDVRLKYPVKFMPLLYDPPEQQYFDPGLIKMSEMEVFVDGGMYIGDTAEIFFKNTHNTFNHYYGFEPEEKIYFCACNLLSDIKNTTLVQKGLYSNETQLRFNTGRSSASHIDVSGDCVIELTSIDSFFSNKPHPPTFIKLDIEGSEFEALKGAEIIIRKHKPKLAICAYHKPEDVFALPELIKSFRDDYVFYLRHYSNFIFETVLYAI
jgi:FkbM family methyltransferase